MGRKSRKRKKQMGKIVLLLLLIWAARNCWTDMDTESGVLSLDEQLQGEWHAHGAEYDEVYLLIDADSISVFDGSGQLCDEEFNMNERTQLITSAYRQDFGIFALFEYKEGEEGINGKPVIVGSVLQEDGSAEEVFFTKK